jgi:hypothetical protein
MEAPDTKWPDGGTLRWSLVSLAVIGCGAPWTSVVREVEELTGNEVISCGGPNIREPDGEADLGCVEDAATQQEPHEYWAAPVTTMEGDPIYQAVIRFWLDGQEHVWGITDSREDAFGDGAVYVTRCVGDVCEPAECLAGC